MDKDGSVSVVDDDDAYPDANDEDIDPARDFGAIGDVVGDEEAFIGDDVGDFDGDCVPGVAKSEF